MYVCVVLCGCQMGDVKSAVQAINTSLHLYPENVAAEDFRRVLLSDQQQTAALATASPATTQCVTALSILKANTCSTPRDSKDEPFSPATVSSPQTQTSSSSQHSSSPAPSSPPNPLQRLLHSESDSSSSAIGSRICAPKPIHRSQVASLVSQPPTTTPTLLSTLNNNSSPAATAETSSAAAVGGARARSYPPPGTPHPKVHGPNVYVAPHKRATAK
jgi:hypothetical protein